MAQKRVSTQAECLRIFSLYTRLLLPIRPVLRRPTLLTAKIFLVRKHKVHQVGSTRTSCAQLRAAATWAKSRFALFPIQTCLRKYYKNVPKHENTRRTERTDQSCQSGTRHEALEYPTAAVAVMEFLREDARATHEDARTETIVDGRDEQNMATASAAVSLGHVDG